MKDYYYILGIRRQADLKEIQSAYQKLSLKFHPKQNGTDPFFANYYRRITEAYNDLSDDQRRYRYDKRLKHFEAKNKNTPNLPPPVIASFFTSKKESYIDELITISWEVLNAENIYIDPIGQVASNGTQTIRLQEELATSRYIFIELKANNSEETNKVNKTLKIRNLSYELETPPKKIAPYQEAEISPSIIKRKKKTVKKNKREKVIRKKTTQNINPNYNSSRNQLAAYIIVAVVVFLMIVMFYIIYTLNPIF